MTNIHFSIGGTVSCLEGMLIYLPSEYAFDFRTAVQHGEHSSIQINSLQLAVDYDGTVLHAYGYCPLLKYREVDSSPPVVNRCAKLIANRGGEWVPGVAYPIKGPSDWPIWVNKRAGWVCLGEHVYKIYVDVVEFAEGSVAVLDGSKLVAVWLHPEALPELP